jgi:hypothetical protein
MRQNHPSPPHRQPRAKHLFRSGESCRPGAAIGAHDQIDLLLFHRNRRIGIEIKRADAPTITPSMQHALNDLRLDALYVVYPGETRYALSGEIEVLSLQECISTLVNLR